MDNNSNGRPFLPKKLLESAQTATSQDPRACSGLPGLELGAANQILVFNSVLTQNYPSFLSAQIDVIRVKLLQQSLKTLPYCFPSFLNEIPESHPPEWILSGIKLSSLSSLHWVLFKDCLGLSWVNCHLMSHLLTFHFLGESWPQI